MRAENQLFSSSKESSGAPEPEVIWCPLDPKPLALNYRHEEETGLYFAGDYNLRGRTPKADVDVCFAP